MVYYVVEFVVQSFLFNLRPFFLFGLVSMWFFAWHPACAQSISFKQAVAQSASTNPVVFKFYKAHNFQSFWTGDTRADRARFDALLMAFSNAAVHGLPAHKFNANALLSRRLAAKTGKSLGKFDVSLTIEFLRYARAVQSGILVPSAVDEGIVRKVAYQDPSEILKALKSSSAEMFFRALPPQSMEYARLLKEKKRLERVVAVGGWGIPVATPTLKVGSKGASVVTLRNRLVGMGYLRRTLSVMYDVPLENAIRAFQASNGLFVTGIAGTLTIDEINVSASERLMSVLVAMERERWLNRELGDRHILVNLTDFTSKVVDFGKVTFETRSVIGAHDEDRRSPEFSDMMEHIIVNPSWHVPRSIIIKEYLPMLQEDPEAVDFLELRDDLGIVVDRADVDFKSFDEETFPYAMRQPPSAINALGLVKFMFPNRNNIYLHDTPAKKLFDREVRAFSHGCVRLAKPFKFAYALLEVQTPNPKLVIQAALEFEDEVQIDLLNPVPVHLIYRTAVTIPGGGLEFRRDIYGRDTKIWEALQVEGVVLNDVTG